MVLYIFILIYLVLCSLFAKKSKILFAGAFILMLLVFALRDVSVGTDTKNYYHLFSMICAEGAESDIIRKTIEPGWQIINKLIYIFNGSWQIVLLISGILVLLPIFISSWRYCENPPLSILIYYLLGFYFSSFNIIRQMIAASIVFAAFCQYFNNKKLFIYFLQILLACCFHYTAIICMLIPLLIKYVRPSVSKAIILLPITIVTGFYIIPNLLFLIPLVGKYAIYLSGEKLNAISETQILYNIIGFLFIMASDKNSLPLKLFYISLIFSNLFGFSEILVRIGMYFQFSILLLTSNINCKFKNNKYILTCCLVMYGFLFISRIFANNSMDILPYISNI